MFSEQGHPPGRGKIERHYRTIQWGFYKEAQLSEIQTLAELNEFFWVWLDDCYHKQIHEKLKEAPLTRWQKEEDSIKRVEPEKLAHALVFRYDRKVDFKTALVNLEGREYLASKAFVGEQVQVRRRFNCIDEVEIWQDGESKEKAREYITPEDIDYSKRPDRKAKPPAGYVLESSKKYRLAMVAKRKDPNYVSQTDDLLAESSCTNS